MASLLNFLELFLSAPSLDILLIPFWLGVILFFIMLFSPLYSYIISLHELGHKLHLDFISRGKGYPKSKIVYYSDKETRHNFTTLHCFLKSSSYFYLIHNCKYTLIRLNSISGTLFVILISFISSLFINVNLYLHNILLITLWLCFIVFELYTFFTSSDFKYFLHPKLFEYPPKDYNSEYIKYENSAQKYRITLTIYIILFVVLPTVLNLFVY